MSIPPVGSTTQRPLTPLSRPSTPLTRSPLGSQPPVTAPVDTLVSASDAPTLPLQAFGDVLTTLIQQSSQVSERRQGVCERVLRGLWLGPVANLFFGRPSSSAQKPPVAVEVTLETPTQPVAATETPVDPSTTEAAAETTVNPTATAGTPETTVDPAAIAVTTTTAAAADSDDDSIVIESFDSVAYATIRQLCYVKKTRPTNDAQPSTEERLLCAVLRIMVASCPNSEKSDEDMAHEALVAFKKATMLHHTRFQFPACIQNGVKTGTTDPHEILDLPRLQNLSKEWNIQQLST